MPRSVWIFLTAILLPAIVLAWLAVRSVRDQQIILEHQQALLDQAITDNLALRLAEEVNQMKEEFIAATQKLLTQVPAPRDLVSSFDSRLRAAWPPAEVGFALDSAGRIFSPQPADGAAATTFLGENSLFLSNRQNAEVYTANNSNLSQNANATANASAPQLNEPVANSEPQSKNSWSFQSLQLSRRVVPAQSQQVQPTLSNSLPAESDFQGVLGQETSGVLGRFMDNKLRLMVWYRSPPYVFGAQLQHAALLERLAPLLHADSISTSEWSSFRSDSTVDRTAWRLALLDDTGRPVAFSRAGFIADWKHPFVATEVGDALPHWEVALYLTDPGQLGRSARILQFTLGLIVLVLLVAIVAGGSLVAADIRRRTLLAQQKTDFVSNISHELKTPLTSIRMFADLLSGERVTDPARRASYLRIISAESSRLTRLINNVLDFARLDRGAAAPERRPCDLAAITREVSDNLRPHLESQQVHFIVELPSEPIPVLGDPDALAQILLNLLSNAEKYGGKEILLRAGRRHDVAFVEVLDRGPGIPSSQAEAIFQPFQRLEDSLASGIPGSGLGLSLARHNAAAHHGRLTYAPREGGGACFTFTLPLSA
ncbi:ATP-binding protein [soil metagenome]